MLIIYAHPSKDNHCGYILQRVKSELEESKTDYKIWDLYEINFDPVLKAEEVYTADKKAVSEENKKLQEELKAQDKVIIIYPTWWNSTPAILKGFFDRVLTKGYAFKWFGKIPRGQLKDIRVAVFTTTGGPKIFNRFLAGNRSIKTVVKDTLKFCGMKAKGFVVDKASKLDDDQKIKVKRAVIKGLEYLNK